MSLCDWSSDVCSSDLPGNNAHLCPSANYGFKDRFFVTGVLRYDGSSKFAEGHKWALFPGLSASWHLTQGEIGRASCRERDRTWVSCATVRRYSARALV